MLISVRKQKQPLDETNKHEKFTGNEKQKIIVKIIHRKESSKIKFDKNSSNIVKSDF